MKDSNDRFRHSHESNGGSLFFCLSPVPTVLARDIDESFELDAAAEAELLLSLAEADRGELIPAEEVLRTFRDAE